MPRTSKISEQARLPEPPISDASGGPGEVLTLAETAAFLRLAEEEVVAAVSGQGLPGQLVGTKWRFSRTGLLRWLGASRPTEEMRRAAMFAAAGSLPDDPGLEDMVEAIYRARGRPITEDGSYRLFHGLKPEDFRK